MLAISISWLSSRLFTSLSYLNAWSNQFLRFRSRARFYSLRTSAALKIRKKWYREIAKKTSHVLHNFQGALSTTRRDGRKDGRRSEASGIVEPDTRLWGVDAGLALLVVRISSRTCPPNVFSARVSTLSGTHYQRVLRIWELGRQIPCSSRETFAQ